MLVLGAGCAEGATRRDTGGPLDAAIADAPILGTDAPILGTDAPILGTDAPILGTDAPILGTDAPILAADAPVAGTGRYLDRCTTNADCASALCLPDGGGTRYCSRSCSTDLQCAHEHLCAGSVCVRDTTGAPCSVGVPESCPSGLCLGSGAGGACTRYCSSAAECPAGFACSVAGGSGMPICIDIERPCTSTGSECASGLCIPGLGCTATCTSAAMCPLRFTTLGLPAYTCGRAFGSTTNICVPPSDIGGADPIGASCPATGTNTCRSGACDTGATSGPMCTQACTAQGGCPAGFGCFPQEDPPGTVSYYGCSRAGVRDLGAACARGSECSSGLCWAPGYCTRICSDGLCPSDMACQVLGGAALCVRP